MPRSCVFVLSAVLLLLDRRAGSFLLAPGAICWGEQLFQHGEQCKCTPASETVQDADSGCTAKLLGLCRFNLGLSCAIANYFLFY